MVDRKKKIENGKMCFAMYGAIVGISRFRGWIEECIFSPFSVKNMEFFPTKPILYQRKHISVQFEMIASILLILSITAPFNHSFSFLIFYYFCISLPCAVLSFRIFLP